MRTPFQNIHVRIAVNRKVKKESRYVTGSTKRVGIRSASPYSNGVRGISVAKHHSSNALSLPDTKAEVISTSIASRHTFVKLVATLSLSSPCALSRGSPLAVSSIIWFCARKSVTSCWPKSLAHADPSLAIKYESIWRYTDGVSHSMLGMLCGTTRFRRGCCGRLSTSHQNDDSAILIFGKGGGCFVARMR